MTGKNNEYNKINCSNTSGLETYTRSFHLAFKGCLKPTFNSMDITLAELSFSFWTLWVLIEPIFLINQNSRLLNKIKIKSYKTLCYKTILFRI